MGSVDNPRFPHTMQVLRPQKDEKGNDMYDDVGNPVFEVVFESVCGLRDMVRGTDVEIEVLKSDYKLSLPKHSFIINFRDTVKVTHSYTGEVIMGEVEASKIWNFGANIWFQSNGNKHG